MKRERAARWPPFSLPVFVTDRAGNVLGPVVSKSAGPPHGRTGTLMIGRATSAIALMLVLFEPAAASQRQVPTGPDQVQLSFSPVVKRVAPAVVNVYASRTIAPQSSPFF